MGMNLEDIVGKIEDRVQIKFGVMSKNYAISSDKTMSIYEPHIGWCPSPLKCTYPPELKVKQYKAFDLSDFIPHIDLGNLYLKLVTDNYVVGYSAIRVLGICNVFRETYNNMYIYANRQKIFPLLIRNRPIESLSEGLEAAIAPKMYS